MVYIAQSTQLSVCENTTNIKPRIAFVKKNQGISRPWLPMFPNSNTENCAGLLTQSQCDPHPPPRQQPTMIDQFHPLELIKRLISLKEPPLTIHR